MKIEPKLSIEVIHKDKDGNVIEHYLEKDGRKVDYGNTG